MENMGRLTNRERRHNNRGVGIAELLMVVALIGIVSTFALIQVQSARDTLRLQSSVRQLASYMEKARVDAVRRHGNSQVLFRDPKTYSVTMDFDMLGTLATRSYAFESGVQLASSDLP